jgi:hypothetical protein
MNDKLIQIGLDSGMLNYVDNETPRHYFLSGHADEQDLQKFAELIVKECIEQVVTGPNGPAHYAVEAALRLQKHFGVEE